MNEYTISSVSSWLIPGTTNRLSSSTPGALASATTGTGSPRNISRVIACAALLASLLVMPLLSTPASAGPDTKGVPCKAEADFPATPSQFDVDKTDEFDRSGRLKGREFIAPNQRLYLRISCFTPADPTPLNLERDKVIQVFFENTRKLGVFGQKYFFRRYPDRTYLTVTGTRKMNGKQFVIRMEQHFFPLSTISLVASYPEGDGNAFDLATAFFESFRAARLGS